MPIQYYVSSKDLIRSIIQSHIDHNVQCKTLVKYCTREMLKYAAIYACSQKKHSLVKYLFREYRLDESVELCVAIALKNKDLDMQQILYNLYPCIDVNKIINQLNILCN